MTSISLLLYLDKLNHYFITAIITKNILHVKLFKYFAEKLLRQKFALLAVVWRIIKQNFSCCLEVNFAFVKYISEF